MTVAFKAGVMLALTFILGGVVGALGFGAVNNERHRAPQEMPPGLGGRMGGPPGGDPNQPPGPRGGGHDRPPSFVDRTLGLIEPRDSAQASALRPFLEETDRHNRSIVDTARSRMHDELQTLRGHIAPLLDADQLRRFDDFAQR